MRSWAKQSYSYNHIVCSFVGHKNALHCLCIFCPYLEADRGAQKPTRKPDTKGQTKNLALSCTLINTSPSKFVFRGYIGSQVHTLSLLLFENNSTYQNKIWGCNASIRPHGIDTIQMFSELTDRIKRYLILGISIESPVSVPMHKLCNGGRGASS